MFEGNRLCVLTFAGVGILLVVGRDANDQNLLQTGALL